MKFRFLPAFFISLFAAASAHSQPPPFSYRGLYEATLGNGAKAVFFVSKNSQGAFGYIRNSNQQLANGTFSVANKWDSQLCDHFGSGQCQLHRDGS